jgi:hypothetical protein
MNLKRFERKLLNYSPSSSLAVCVKTVQKCELTDTYKKSHMKKNAFTPVQENNYYVAICSEFREAQL